MSWGDWLSRRRGRHRVAGLIVFLILGGLGAWFEARTSALQSLLLSQVARNLTYDVRPGAADSIQFPTDGPFDVRHGYTLIPRVSETLATRGFGLSSQASWSPWLERSVRLGCYPIYPRKMHVGLILLDRNDEPLYAICYPQRSYKDFEEIPDLLLQTLLFIENRELFEGGSPYLNPAIEWDRAVRALLELGLGALGVLDNPSGGSTLATQMEKFQHSSGGLTASPREKVRQIISASLRAYLTGRETLAARRRILLEYVNSVPLAATPYYGEVIGIGDGLWAWFDQDFDEANRLLRETMEANAADPAGAEVYKRVLSLLVAHRRPHTYLIEDRAMLEDAADSYLRLLAEAEVIPEELRDAALGVPLVFRGSPAKSRRPPYVMRKAANAVRTQLLDLLDLGQLYVLDRIDLTAGTTLDRPAQQHLTHMLGRLKQPAVVDSLGLRGERLLALGDPAGVIYSFTLYEATPEGNLLRLQIDSYDEPLDINLGAKLDLGSTAKLRTLANYLEIVAGLHRHHAGRPRVELKAAEAAAEDPLRRWAFGHLADSADTTLAPMLQAALGRTYSASPRERFFTGGGEHTFQNFSEDDDHKVLSVQEAFRRSVNLVFIRLMRDIVRYYQHELPGYAPELLQDSEDPRRREYLARYADKEGKQFLARFFREYEGMNGDDALEKLALRTRKSAPRMATLFRSARPDATVDSLAAFLARHLSADALERTSIEKLFNQYNRERFDLQDRAFILQVDPMELWLVSYLQTHRGPSWREVVESSAAARQEAYRWLFETRSQSKQNTRIRIMIEEEAFDLVHQSWQHLGYPFDSFVPSYASAIGSSADRPAALAALVGIIANDGLRIPTRRLEYLCFARGTPFETNFSHRPARGERVLPAEVTRALRGALIDVVEHGTARGCHGAFRRADGSVIPVGGKTGTGDHRYETVGRGGKLIESRVVSRAATLVFLIGDRHFGAITAVVPGPEAADYAFTSSLPTHLLAAMAPELMSLVDGAEE